MKIVLFVHVRKTLQRLEHYVSDHLLWKQLLTFLHQLVNVHIKKLKDKVQSASIQNNLIQLNNIRMTKLHQGLNLFLVNALVPLGVFFLHSFNGHNFAYNVHIKILHHKHEERMYCSRVYLPFCELTALSTDP